MRVSVVKESLTTPLILALLLTLAGCASANKPRTYTVVEFGQVLREERAISMRQKLNMAESVRSVRSGHEGHGGVHHL